MHPWLIARDRLRWIGHRIASTSLATNVFPQAWNTARDYAQLIRLDRPIGTYLLFWPALWALWLASNGKPNEHIFIVFMLGVFLTRSAGCVINDFADRNIDPHVARTRNRPLAAGRIKPSEALALFAGLVLISFGLVLTLNRQTILLSLIGAGLMATYPFMKRFFPLPQVYLGAAYGWAVPMAFAAQSGTVPRIGWVVFMAAVLWITAYDTMYAMVDREDDLKIGVRSSAVTFGDADRFIVGIMQLMALLALWLVGREMQLGMWYRSGLGAAACFALYEQFLIRNRTREGCFAAFLNNNYFGMAVFVGIALEYFFKS